MVGMGLCGLDGMRPACSAKSSKGRLRLFILSHERPWRMTAYALSRDGLHYEDLLGGDPVYDVEQRVRDGDDGYEQP